MTDKPIFITGIGTGIGKTIVSAIIVEKLKADYWKPIQSGDLETSDTLTVADLISNKTSVFHTETYRLSQPFSPHKSAAIDGVSIEAHKFIMPKTDNVLIIEGAGGLMVPLNNQFLIVDLIKQLNAEVILVSRNYLGSINHTLLSVFALKQWEVPIKGIVFNGAEDIYSKEYIVNYTGLEVLGHIPDYDVVDKNTIIDAGNYIKF